MSGETKNYGNETPKSGIEEGIFLDTENGLEEEKKLDTENTLKETNEGLGEIISGISFSVNKNAYEKSPEGEKQMRILATLIAFMGKAVELGTLDSKIVIYKLAKIGIQTKKELNLKENPIKID